MISKISRTPHDIFPSRSAGVLMHVSSLPSKFGIGDLGPEVQKFVAFLQRSKQRYWQVLPVNPTGPAQGYSPYSSISSMAGNILLISLEQLVRDGLLSASEVNRLAVKQTENVNWLIANETRQKLLPLAYQRFIQEKKASQRFTRFCQREDYWLHDFALFVALKQHHGNSAWFKWPLSHKNKEKNALDKFSNENAKAIEFIKWQQFIFFEQWDNLKRSCHQFGVQVLGDLPFYVSYDSVDVWSHREIFNISKVGDMTGVAGVPPDYFNSNGQLWGMPTFKWNVLKQNGYRWWVQRIKKNMELFDVLRLDHFRAFADYWEVPANHSTAKRGKWKPGPGNEFFEHMKQALGRLPFVAEDLGDINDAVYALRDHFNLPGMKVLQFAFGDTMPSSDYIPHNYATNFVVYTGTHDNNTTRGWYRTNISFKERHQLGAYLGKPIDEKNVSLELSRLAYASVARTAILPIQDILGLDEKARMNTPASIKNNWQWRLKPGLLTKSVEQQLAAWASLYNRAT